MTITFEGETAECGECGAIERDNGEDMEGWEYIDGGDITPGYWVCPKCQ